MHHGRLPAVLVAALALALAAAAAAGQGRPAGDEAIEPAPPPVGYCRERPSEWPAFGTGVPAPDLTPYQDYRAGLGIDGAFRGAGVTIADIEYEWRSTHRELAPHGLAVAPPSGLAPGWQAADHGTAVLGILAGSDDGAGITGLAPDATLVPTAPNTAPNSYKPWLEVAAVAATLDPGDVLLIELQAGLSTPTGAAYAPIEVYEPMRKAIRDAVDRGIVVVEPAGNGGRDLGEIVAATVPARTAPWLLSATGPAHSGALIVGGGGAGVDASGTADLARAGISNHGPRVDVQGYGAGVVTAGYGDAPWSPPGDDAYTACFDGTSSAAATIAAAVAVLQSAEIERDGTPLTPAQVRSLLVSTGTPQADPGNGHIGPRPDVAAAIAALPELDVAPPPAADAPPPPDRALAPPPPALVLDAAGAVTPAPVEPATPPLIVSGSRRLPAATGLTARVNRRARTLAIRLARLAPRAVVRVGGRRVTVRRGRVVVRLPRRAVKIVVRAPAVAGVRRRAVTYRVVIPPRRATTFRATVRRLS